MAGDVNNPRIWEGADVYVAPYGTSGPTDVSTDWSASWEPLGLLSEDGMSESRDQDSTDHYAYGGILVRTTRSKFKRQLKVTCLEDNPTVWGLVNPGSSSNTVGGLTTRQVKNPTKNVIALGFEVADGDVITRRIVARCELTNIGEVKFADSDMTGYELTFTIYPVSDLLYTDITNDAQAAPSVETVPSLTSVTPATEPLAGGGLHILRGVRFTGTTAVTVGGETVTDFEIESDGVIAFIAPARTAGAKPIVVTNAAGASTDVLNLTYS